MTYIRIWEFEVPGGLTSLDITPARGHVATGSADGRLSLLSPRGSPLWHIDLGSRILDVRCSEDARHVVAATDGNVLVAADYHGRLIWKKELKSAVSAIDLRPGSGMITTGNRYKIYRNFSISGKPLGRGGTRHPVDFIRFAPGGKACALASEDGHLTLLGYGGEELWSAFVHRQIIGLDVATRASTIILPSKHKGIVILDSSGKGVGVYEMKGAIVAAEIDDGGNRLIALEETGRLILLDREANLISLQNLGFPADRLAVDSDGKTVAVAAGRTGHLACYKFSSKESSSAEFIEIRERRPAVSRTQRDKVTYLEID